MKGTLCANFLNCLMKGQSCLPLQLPTILTTHLPGQFKKRDRGGGGHAHLFSLLVGSQPIFFSTSFCTSPTVMVGCTVRWMSGSMSVLVSMDSCTNAFEEWNLPP